MPTVTSRCVWPLLLLLGAVAPASQPVARHPEVADLQAVFGPAGVDFDRREYLIDLNGDGHPEVVVLLADRKRGLPPLPIDTAAFTREGGTVVDGFAVFDGVHPDIPVFYQYFCYDGIQLRVDKVDGQTVLVSDSGRDHLQQVWGWRTYPGGWPVSGWEARERPWDENRHGWGETWHGLEKFSAFLGK
jgi:hypothetical protein